MSWIRVDLLEQHAHLALGVEAGERRFATGAYGSWRAHVHALLAAAGVPASGRDALVGALLAPLAPEVYRYQRRARGRTRRRSPTRSPTWPSASVAPHPPGSGAGAGGYAPAGLWMTASR